MIKQSKGPVVIRGLSFVFEFFDHPSYNLNTRRTMQDKLCIYILEDPSEVSQTIYVGYTINSDRRFKRHIEEATSNRPERNRYRNCWIRSLLNRGVMPKMIILEEINDENWQEAERYYIAYFKYIGLKLCNDTNGGDGTLGMKHSNETKEKMRHAKLGTTKTDISKDKVSHQIIKDNIFEIIELYSAKYSLREIAQLFDANHQAVAYRLGRAGIVLREQYEVTERSKEKLQQANIGKIQSEETKQKRSNLLNDRKRSPEICAKISASHMGKKLSEEHRRKLSIAKQGAGSPTFRTDIDNSLIIDLYNKGLSLRAIGKEIGLEHHAVKARLKNVSRII